MVAYHLWPEMVPGGWLGVSVFFTLSGFLITGILIRDHTPTAASMAVFWTSRARRLLPAALTVISATLAATAMVDPDSLRRVAGDALASVLYVQNWREAAAPGGYDAIFDTGLRPLAHMWSLAIEEQVYVVLPLAVLWLGPRRMLLVGALVGGAGTAVWWGSPDAYYATPVRMVEVLAGAALAWWLSTGRRLRVPRTAGLVAGAGLLAGVAGLSESSGWVSRGALVAAAGAATVVIAVALGGGLEPLGARPLRWLGHRSYAIYLLHWPLLVLTELNPLAVIGVTLLLAEVSHHLLEWPVRSGRVVRNRVGPTFAALSLVVLSTAVLTLAVAPRAATDDQVADLAAAALLAETPAAIQPSTQGRTDRVERVVPADVATGTIAASDRPAATPATAPVDERIAVVSEPHVQLIGDSTAVAVEPAVRGWVAVGGGTFTNSAEGHCAPVFTPEEYRHWSTVLLGRPPGAPCRESVQPGVDLVIVIDNGMPLFNYFDHRVDGWTDISVPAFRDTVDRLYRDILDDARAAGATVVITKPPVSKVVFHFSTDPARRTAYLELLDGLVADYDHVHLLEEWGDGIDADPDRYPRTDGLHLDRETGAVAAVVELLAPAFRSAR